MIPDSEVARRAAAYFASVRVPAGGVLIPRSTPLAFSEIATMFAADLVVNGVRVTAFGNGPVVIDRRNGAIIPLGTGGQPSVLFDDYLREHAQSPPPAYTDPPRATSPSPPLPPRPKRRPTVPLRPRRGSVPKRPWPPSGQPEQRS